MRNVLCIGCQDATGRVVVTDVLCFNLPEMTPDELAALSFKLDTFFAYSQLKASGNAQAESPGQTTKPAPSQAGVAESPANPNAGVKQVYEKGRW